MSALNTHILEAYETNGKPYCYPCYMDSIHCRLLSSKEYQYNLGTFYDKDKDRTIQKGF